MNLSKIEYRLKTIIRLVNYLQKDLPDNHFIENLSTELDYLISELNEQPNSSFTIPENIKLKIVKNAKLHILNEVIKDLEYQKEHRCSNEDEKKIINQSIKYVDRKINYYKTNR